MMKILTYSALAIIFALSLVFGVDYLYESTVVKATTNNSQNLPKQVSKHVQQQKEIKEKLVNIPFDDYKVIEETPPHFLTGFDWSLPAYADEALYSGLIAEENHNLELVKNSFVIVRWDEANPEKGKYNFSRFEKDLKRIAPQKVLVRLEVNSACEAPKWALKKLRSSKDKSLIFWDKDYITLLESYIGEFAKHYASSEQIVGVQLGIGDGEFTGSCDNKDGWGEFWMSPQVLAEAEQNFGFTPELFEVRSKEIIDIYATAFGSNKHKLAYTNIGPSFSWDEIAIPYNQRLIKLAHYTIGLGIGNRDGAIERWMSYTDKIYGNIFTSMLDGTCRLDFDEAYAEKIRGRYWGTENEFYGNKGYVIAVHGSFENQPYRFLISSLRALQMRRNFMSISNDMRVIDHPIYKTQEFLRYLTKIMGKQIENTPDAFVLMGERYIEAYRLENHKDAECVKNNGDIIPIRSFGRWLSESPQNTLLENAPAIKIRMEAKDNYWGQKYYLPDGIDYEYFARKADQFSFDLNDQLAEKRCKKGCEVEIKATFKDTIKTALNAYVAEGKSQSFETRGDGKIITVSFKIKSAFKNGIASSDIILKSEQGAIPLILFRVNFLQL
jgi:hypothetical protein